jgi:hypothetical protein
MISVTIRVITDEDTNAGFELDLQDHEDFPLSLNYGISEVRDIISTRSTFSKAFRIPATKDNNKNLQNIYYSSIDDTSGVKNFNKCEILVNSMPILKGTFKVRNVINTNGFIEYECVIFGDNYNWISKFRDIELRDLDFSAAVHTYNDSTIEASWTDQYGNPADADDRDYLYPIISYGTFPNNEVTSDDLRPAVWIKSILDKAWDQINSTEDINYSISSTFLDGTFFKRLFMPFSSGLMTSDVNKDAAEDIEARDSDIEEYEFSTSYYVNPLVTTNGTRQRVKIQEVVSGNDQTALSGNYWDENNSIYYADNSCVVSLDFSCQVAPISALGEITSFKDIAFVVAVRPNATTNTNILHRVDASFPNRNWVNVKINLDDVTLSQGDELFIYMILLDIKDNDGNYISGTQFMKIQQPQVNVTKSTQVVLNQSIDISDTLPDMKMGTFFKGLAHMFNLYVSTNEITKTITIEPRDDFYQGTSNAVDWTSKLDLGGGYVVKFIDNFKRVLNNKYKDDSSDKLVDKFNKTRVVDLGAGEINLSARFPEGVTDVVNPFFSPTIHQRMDINQSGIGVSIDQKNILPALWNSVGYEGEASTPSYQFAPRILYYDYKTQLDSGGSNIGWKFNGSSKTQIPTGYFQENFAETSTTGYNLGFEGTTGLIENYYQGELGVIDEGVMLTARFDLTFEDINALDLSKPIHISAPTEIAGYYYINNVSDYQPTRRGTTKVELLKTIKTGKKVTTAKNVAEAEGFSSKDGNKDKDIYSDGFTGGFTRGDKKDRNSDIIADLEDIDDYVDNVWNIGDDPQEPIEIKYDARSRGAESFDVKTGGGGYVKPGAGSLNLGFGGRAVGDKQTTLGRWNKEKPDAQLIIGSGTSSSNRSNVMTIDRSGKTKFYGGEVFMENTNGDIVPVYTETRDGIEKVYLSDD